MFHNVFHQISYTEHQWWHIVLNYSKLNSWGKEWWTSFRKLAREVSSRSKSFLWHGKGENWIYQLIYREFSIFRMIQCYFLHKAFYGFHMLSYEYFIWYVVSVNTTNGKKHKLYNTDKLSVCKSKNTYQYLYMSPSTCSSFGAFLFPCNRWGQTQRKWSN